MRVLLVNESDAGRVFFDLPKQPVFTIQGTGWLVFAGIAAGRNTKSTAATDQSRLDWYSTSKNPRSSTVRQFFYSTNCSEE